MLESTVHIELPTEEILREPSGWDRVWGLIGQPPQLGTGEVRLTVPTPELLEKIRQGFAASHLTNVVWIICDGEVVYLDERNMLEDLDEDLLGSLQSRIGESFEALQIAVAHDFQGIHALVVARVRTRGRLGAHLMELRVSARLHSLSMKPGEDASAFVKRIRAFASKWARVEAYRVMVRRFAHEIADKMAEAFGKDRVVEEETWVRVEPLQSEGLAQLRQLRFGDQVSMPRYRPAPQVSLRGVFDDPFTYYWWDPYANLRSWALMDAIVHQGCWNSEHVRLVEPGGTTICRGDEVVQRKQFLLVKHRLARIGEEGNLIVDPSVAASQFDGDPLADQSRWTPAATGSPYAPRERAHRPPKQS